VEYTIEEQLDSSKHTLFDKKLRFREFKNDERSRLFVLIYIYKAIYQGEK
jgi:hypothetical protein